MGRGLSFFPLKFFCFTVPKIFVGEYFTVALISDTEKIRRRGGGGIKILRRKCFVSQCLKFPWGNSFSVALILGIEKVWIRGGGGGYQDFPSQIFFFVGESFAVALISVSEKVWIGEGGSFKIFRRKFFVSQCLKFP